VADLTDFGEMIEIACVLAARRRGPRRTPSFACQTLCLLPPGLCLRPDPR